MQALTETPHVYRQFGYEPAPVGDPGRFASVASLPPPPAEGGTAIRFRPPVGADLPFIARLYAFPDCWTAGPAVQPLLDALFPKQASSIWPIA